MGETDVVVGVGDADVVVGVGDALVVVGVGDTLVVVGVGDALVVVGVGVAEGTVIVFLMTVVNGVTNAFGPPVQGGPVALVAPVPVCPLHEVTAACPTAVPAKLTDSTEISTEPVCVGVTVSTFDPAGP